MSHKTRTKSSLLFPGTANESLARCNSTAKLGQKIKFQSRRKPNQESGVESDPPEFFHEQLTEQLWHPTNARANWRKMKKFSLKIVHARWNLSADKYKLPGFWTAGGVGIGGTFATLPKANRTDTIPDRSLLFRNSCRTVNKKNSKSRPTTPSALCWHTVSFSG